MPLISTLSRRKSLGRLARSVEMMTHLPVMGSFLSSGKHSSCPRTSTYEHNIGIMRERLILRRVAARCFLDCGPILLGRKRSLVEPHDGAPAGAGIDGENIESKWSAAGFIFAQELPRDAG